MNDVQRELISILERLDEHEQQQLLLDARELERESHMTPQEFLAYADVSLAALREKRGPAFEFNSLDVLTLLRDEWDEELGG